MKLLSYIFLVWMSQQTRGVIFLRGSALKTGRTAGRTTIRRIQYIYTNTYVDELVQRYSR